MNRTMMALQIIAMALGAGLAGCSGTLDVRISDARVVGEEVKCLLVEVTTDRDVVALEGSKWAAVVLLCYSVDGNKPVKVDSNAMDYDLRSITYTRPFLAQLVNRGTSAGDAYVSRWMLRLSDSMNVSPMVFEYRLDDGNTHTLTFEVYGASYSGGYLRSNPVTITVGSGPRRP